MSAPYGLFSHRGGQSPRDSPTIEMVKTDAVIVGAGPAGSAVANFLARENFHTVLIEKRPKIGFPIRCGEATGSRDEISRFIPVNEAWISADINAVRFFAPGGRILEKHLSGIGVVLDRALFDEALADQARDSGADVRVNTEAVALLRKNGAVTGVKVYDHATQKSYEIQAKVTIGADGIEGFIGRWAGLTRSLKLDEIHSAVQYLLEAEGLPLDTIELYAGRKIAPGGYAWVFPKKKGSANVGLGVHPSMIETGTPKDLLDRFVSQHFPGATIHGVLAGGTSGTKPLKTMAGAGILLVGEAAHQNNPFSGGGIMNALEGAWEAANVLLEAKQAGDFSARFLRRYDKRWERRAGSTIAKYALLRKLFYQLEDKELDGVAAVLQSIIQKNGGKPSDIAEIFKTALKNTPGLLWKARTLLW